MNNENSIDFLKKQILVYNKLIERFPNDIELQEDCLDAIEGCFQQIAFIELRLAGITKEVN